MPVGIERLEDCKLNGSQMPILTRTPFHAYRSVSSSVRGLASAAWHSALHESDMREAVRSTCRHLAGATCLMRLPFKASSFATVPVSYGNTSGVSVCAASAHACPVLHNGSRVGKRMKCVQIDANDTVASAQCTQSVGSGGMTMWMSRPPGERKN